MLGSCDLVMVMGMAECPGLSCLAPNFGCRMILFGPWARWLGPISNSDRSLALLMDVRATRVTVFLVRSNIESSCDGAQCLRVSSTSATSQVGRGAVAAGGRDRKMPLSSRVTRG